MKKLLNAKEDIMNETMRGYALQNQKRLKLNAGTHQMVRRIPKEKGKVKLVVGNGGGHEPCLLGWIGKGMYDLDCLGEVFTAQAGEVFYEGIRCIDDGSPILLTIANHAGDVLNGNLAYALALEDGMQIRKVLFYDDIASAPKGFEEERRGMAGMMFSVKTAGAAAEAGESLDKCAEIFERARDNTRTFAIALTPGTHPLTGSKMFEVPENAIEMGGGIHGEGGMETIPFTTCREVCAQVCSRLLEDLPYVQGDEVVIIVNGSGASTMMELSIFYQDTVDYLTARGIHVYDGVTGNFITTQETAGLSLSLCRLDKELKELWDAPCSTPSYCNM